MSFIVKGIVKVDVEIKDTDKCLVVMDEFFKSLDIISPSGFIRYNILNYIEKDGKICRTHTGYHGEVDYEELGEATEESLLLLKTAKLLLTKYY